MTISNQNWTNFEPIEEEDPVIEIQVAVKLASVEAEPAPTSEKLGDTIWFGSQPTPAFKLNLGD